MCKTVLLSCSLTISGKVCSWTWERESWAGLRAVMGEVSIRVPWGDCLWWCFPVSLYYCCSLVLFLFWISERMCFQHIAMPKTPWWCLVRHNHSQMLCEFYECTFLIICGFTCSASSWPRSLRHRTETVFNYKMWENPTWRFCRWNNVICQRVCETSEASVEQGKQISSTVL